MPPAMQSRAGGPAGPSVEFVESRSSLSRGNQPATRPAQSIGHPKNGVVALFTYFCGSKKREVHISRVFPKSGRSSNRDSRPLYNINVGLCFVTALKRASHGADVRQSKSGP